METMMTKVERREAHWDSEKKALTVGSLAFKWLPEWKLPETAKGYAYFFTTLGSTVMLNNVTFSSKQKIRCAGSLIGAPINENHIRYELEGTNIIVDTETEENRLEGLAYVEDTQLNEAYDKGDIIGCSIDYYDRGNAPENKDFVAEGVWCVGLGFITIPYICGDPTSRVWRATAHHPSVRDYIRRELTMSECEAERARRLLGLTPEEWLELSDEERANKLTSITSSPDHILTVDQLTKVLELEDISSDDRLDWLEEDVRSLYNQLWALEETYFARLDSTEKRIDDIVMLLSGQKLEAQQLVRLLRATGFDEDEEGAVEVLSEPLQAFHKLFEEPKTQAGVPKTDAERAQAHFELSEDEWNALSEEDQVAKLAELPELGSGRTELPEMASEVILSRLSAIEATIAAQQTPPVVIDDEHYAYIDGDDKHLRMKDDEGNYTEELLAAATVELLSLIDKSDIPHEHAESARHLLLEGYEALELNVPEGLTVEEVNAIAGKNLKLLAHLHSDDPRRPSAWRNRYHPTLGRNRRS